MLKTMFTLRVSLLCFFLVACGGGGGGGESNAPISDSGSDKTNETKIGKLKSLSEINGELTSLDGYLFANENGIYHWSDNLTAEFIDIVLLRPDGERSTYSFDRHQYGKGLYTNLPLDSSRDIVPMTDNGFYYREITAPVEKKGDYYFSTILGVNEDGSDNFQDWMMNFGVDGAPEFIKVTLSEPACNQVYTINHTCNIGWTYAANLNNNDASDDIHESGLPFDKLYSKSYSEYATYINETAGLLVDGYWYGVTDQNDSQISFVIVNPRREKTYVDINVNDSLGSPVRSIAATTLRYHPQLNTIFFVARDPAPSYISRNLEYIVGGYNIDEGKLQWTVTKSSNYHDIMSAIALAKDGIYILSDDLGLPCYYDSKNNTVSKLEVDVPSARIPFIVGQPYMLPNGNFFYVEKIYNWDLRENRVMFGQIQ
ncbi:hypothetical protein LZU85_02255 [Vibrio sp. IRLE0018]|uniref:hypothetical protein n=1 Tax=Vibrio floridensis TaxID=2908007 RepID=UPI001F2E12C5|nr:hypothetical protein [Vibrio floridensis]MCF8777610.1 hypothetical protein [Vibrio floridensis]